MEPVDVVHYTDPACPWAYSAEPFFAAGGLTRYGAGLPLADGRWGFRPRGESADTG